MVCVSGGFWQSMSHNLYHVKTRRVFCEVDPYIDDVFRYSMVLPGVTYEQIYDYLVSGIHSLNTSKQNAFKGMDAYRTVYAEVWLSSLEVKEWKKGVIVRGDVKPSQRNGILYKVWVVIQKSGAIVSGHCTCMTGMHLRIMYNHVGALLYKCKKLKTVH